MPGIEPGAFHMQSERATTALHPLIWNPVRKRNKLTPFKNFLLFPLILNFEQISFFQSCNEKIC